MGMQNDKSLGKHQEPRQKAFKCCAFGVTDNAHAVSASLDLEENYLKKNSVPFWPLFMDAASTPARKKKETVAKETNV